MKIWHGYGTEHSMNLVMIGHFKNNEDAKDTEKLIKELSNELPNMIDVDTHKNKYDQEVFELLRKKNCYTLSPADLVQFLYDVSSEVEDDKIILTTEESDVSAFFKLMVNKGAKVEIYSAHDYPDSEHGRGK